MKEKKPFKETKVGSWLKDKFPDVLDAAAGLTGIDALRVVGDLIEGKELNPTDKMEYLALKQEYELEVMRLEVDNVKSAREREIGVTQATGRPDYAQWTVGFIGLVISGAVVYTGLFGHIQDREIYFHLLGVVEGAILLSIFNYYFGSSLGSKNKDEKIKDLFK